MLLQLENATQEYLLKLIALANQLNLRLSVIDEESSDHFLPGKPLTDIQLTTLIESGRKSGKLTMKDAHELIRKNFNLLRV